MVFHVTRGRKLPRILNHVDDEEYPQAIFSSDINSDERSYGDVPSACYPLTLDMGEESLSVCLPICPNMKSGKRRKSEMTSSEIFSFLSYDPPCTKDWRNRRKEFSL